MEKNSKCTISLSLYNKIANDILLEVKPVKLRKQIISRLLTLIDDEYQRGFSDGCDYETKIETLTVRNEYLEQQLASLQTAYNSLLTQPIEAPKKSTKKSIKKAIDQPLPGQLTIFDLEAF